MKVSKHIIALFSALIATFSVYAQDSPNCGKVRDIDGNEYNTVLLDGQCWLRENLRTTRYSDGRSINPSPKIPNAGLEQDSRSLRKEIQKNPAGEITGDNFGLLYDWFSVLDSAEPTEETDGRIQGPCPDGWHVPSNFEWMNMEDYIGKYFRCGDDINNMAKALASKEFWKPDFTTIQNCSITEDAATNDASNFSVLPAGMFWNDSYQSFGYTAGFWTCSNGSEETSPIHYFYSNSSKVEINCTPKEAYYSVRCVKNNR